METLVAMMKTSAARPRRVNEIVNGKRGVTTDTALRFAKALGTTSDVWLNMQRMVDLYEALHSPKAREIARIKPFVRKAVA